MWFVWKLKNRKVMNLARATLEKRNSKTYQFDTKRLKVNDIVQLDIKGLRQGLMQRRWTSTDLVNIFAERCYTIGRELNLSTEEGFADALKMAE